MLISKEMYEYLTNYMEWVDNTEVHKKKYFCKTGLCTNLKTYADLKSMGELEYLNLCGDILIEMSIIFEAEGLDRHYPFGEQNYRERLTNKTQHEDPARLKWIKDHIEEYENSLVTA